MDFVNLRVTAQVAGNGDRALDLGSAARSGREHAAAAADRDVYFGSELGSLATPVIPRAELSANPANGPLVIEEYDVTSIVPPGWQASVDPSQSIVLTRLR